MEQFTYQLPQERSLHEVMDTKKIKDELQRIDMPSNVQVMNSKKTSFYCHYTWKNEKLRFLHLKTVCDKKKTKPVLPMSIYF